MDKRSGNEEKNKNTPLVFAETVERGMEAIAGRGDFEGGRKFDDVRLETITRFLDFLGFEDAADMAQEVIDRRHNVEEIIRIWERGGLAGLKLFFSLSKKPGEEKHEETREQKEKSEDAEPELKRNSGSYGSQNKEKEFFLELLVKRGLIEDSPESLEFWVDFLEEIKGLDRLMTSFFKN